MGSTSKSHKVSEDMNVKISEDRISNLPSCLIGHILSFLPTKHAVATSVFSTKWKYFWALTTDLEFDDLSFRDSDFDRLTPSLQTSFTNFIYRVLQLIGESSSIRKFHLECCKSYHDFHVNTWICTILESNVQEISLSVPMKNLTGLPESLFTCKTLVELELGTSFAMNVPSSVSLPCLKFLHLRSNEFSDDSSITRLFNGCPVLERLHMSACIGSGVEAINISSPTLTTLTMELLPYINGVGIFNYKIVLNTPSLKQLSICDYITRGYKLKGLNRLASARLHIIRPLDSDEFEGIHCEALVELLQGISGVQLLHLEDDAIEAIVLCRCRLPMFRNLTELKLGADINCKLLLLPELLLSTPRLVTLTFEEGLGSCREFRDDNVLRWNPPQDVPNCLMFNLKVIDVSSFKGYREEVKVLEYFVKNACVLEKVTLHCVAEMLASKKLEVSTDLFVLPRASRTCQIELAR